MSDAELLDQVRGAANPRTVMSGSAVWLSGKFRDVPLPAEDPGSGCVHRG